MSDLKLRSARDWEEVGRAVDATYRAFDNRTTEDPFFRERMLDTPFLPLENVLVGLVDGAVVTGLCINDRNLYFSGHQVWAGAIGPVFTVPEHRSQGYATRLMEYCHTFMGEKGYALSYLTAGPGRQSFYRELGWESVPSPAAVVTDPASVEPGGGEWSPVAPERHAATLCETYRRQYRHVDGATARPLVYWTDRVFDVESGGMSDWSVALWENGDDPRGYAVWDVEDGTVTCHELAYAGTDRASFYRDCWNRLARAGDRVVWKPPLAPLDGVLEESVETEVIKNFMVRVVDGDVLSAVSEASLLSAEDVVDHVAGGDWYWSKV